MIENFDNLLQQWTAVSGTFGKARKAPRKVLPDAEAVFMPPGSRLRGRLVGEMGPYLVIDNAAADGMAPFDDSICFFHKAHWAESTPAPAKSSAKASMR